jgi:hypothetical protein
MEAKGGLRQPVAAQGLRLQLLRTSPTDHYLYECKHTFHIPKIERNNTPHNKIEQLKRLVAQGSHL